MSNIDIQKYFESMETEVARAYDLANRARKNGFDPEQRVDIPLAKNIFERVEGLIGSVKPELVGSGLAKRLEELDKKYGSGDWRVGLVITDEVAKRKFCQFEDDREAMELGVRVGLAYLTMGVVAAPLEGFIELKLKDRADGQKYASAYFAGPIRAAGGTAAAVTLILVDYVRRQFNIHPVDITDEEIFRNISECDDYHEKVARLQYYPTGDEINFLLKNIPIEINGDPTSEREVLVHKNLPRIGTPRIRGGMCLVLCEGLAGKAAKIFKNIKKWGKEFGLEEWMFLEKYLELKIKAHAGETKKDDILSDIRIKPNTVFIEETVAGRPIFSYPMTKGGFRIRYGRSRVSGLAACSVHPATMRILGNFIATGAQLRMERPGKACAATPCTSIDGPIIKLIDESVVPVNTEEDAIKYKNLVKEILFLGDILIPYGEFARNNHILVPSPYVEEWWIQELQKAAGPEFKELKNFDAQQLVDLSEKYSIPLHPSLLSFYADISSEDMVYLMDILSKSTVSKNENGIEILIPHDKLTKKILEDLCTFHKLTETGILIQNEHAIGLLCAFGFYPGQKWDIEKARQLLKEKKKPLELLNSLSKFKIMNKTGIYLGARLGRPEKAKQRKMKGNPHILFPVGSEGGRMRSINEALAKGYIEASVPVFECTQCKARSIYPKCNKCGSEAKSIRFCQKCAKETNAEMHCGIKTAEYHRDNIDIRMMLDSALKNLNITLPPLIKGVRGTSNKKKIPEPLEKGILRAIHDVFVNKDGTIRYDIIETPITHFKPKEIGTSIEQLKKLGYLTDMLGKPLENDNQVIELLSQDVILPDCKEWQDASALVSIEKICSFIDDLLVRYYHEEPYYNIKSPSDMVGQLIIGLAPHTSAGIIGRIIGFSKTQCFFAHPYFHSACRRNCDGDELCFLMLMDALLNFSRQYLPDKRGGRSVPYDTPIFIEKDNKIQTVEIGTLIDEHLIKNGIKNDGGYELNRTNPEKIKVLSFNPVTRKTEFSKISSFIRHPVNEELYEIKTTNGRLTTTKDHSIFITNGKAIIEKRVDELKKMDAVVVLNNTKFPEKQLNQINLIELLHEKEIYFEGICNKLRNRYNSFLLHEKQGLNAKYGSNNISRWLSGKRAAPIEFIKRLGIDTKTLRLRLQKGKTIPAEIKLKDSFFSLLGYLLSEGHFVEGHNCEITNSKKEIVQEISDSVFELLRYRPTIKKDYHKKNPYYRVYLPKILKILLNKLGIAFNKAAEKEVPFFVFNATQKQKLAFIDAYVKGDGHCYSGKNYTKIYSKSKKMVSGLALLLSSLDFKTTCHNPKRNGVYELLFSKINNTDPYWPLWDYTREISQALRQKGWNKKKIHSFIGNYYAKTRKRTASLNKIKELVSLMDNKETSKLKKEFSKILNSDLKTELVVDIKKVRYNKKYVYDIEVPSAQNFLCGPHPIFAHNSMDAPLVLTTRLEPSEVDDEVYNMDIADIYPLEFYQATLEWKSPYDVKIRQVQSTLGKPEQYQGFFYTHPTENINAGNRISSYKTLVTVFDKVNEQMALAEKTRAVNKSDIARIIIEKHFLKDIKGNLRRFSKNEFRCVSCNERYRRIPLAGRCLKCSGKLIFTVAEGTVSKYLAPSMSLAEKYSLPSYLKQTLDILKRAVDSVFGKEVTKQVGLKGFIK